ncbi:MAG: UvrB/UvrC motif-containing protein [Actinomycetota bacterium]|nr:UvrB/UvrC motif-containing protein [Actinomycetota bacterium]
MRLELGRDPDPGDLLVVLACATHTLAGRASNEIGLDLDTLWGTIQKLRQEDQRAREQLTSEIADLARAKEQAIEEQRFEDAGRLRDEERELRERSRPATAPPGDIVQEARRRLGIPSPEEDAPQAPDSR